MMLRPCRPADLSVLTALFHGAVHTLCAADYTPAQLDAWAPASPDRAAWAAALAAGTTLVAEEDGAPLGFGTVLPEGHLELLFVHKDHRGRGVGSVLCDFLELRYPAARLTVHASKTARGFFEHRGYRVLQERQAQRRGQVLTNYLMEKEME